MAKQPTEKQLAARKAFGEAAKARAAERKKKALMEGYTPEEPKEAPRDIGIDEETHVAPDPDMNDLLRQMKELQESNALLKAAVLGQQATPGAQSATDGRGQVQIGAQGRLLGEVEKYLVDPANYPDPTPRLMKESRLAPLAFDYNYEMAYEVGVSTYETKTGVNTREPKFTVTLNRVVLNDQGEQTNKRYIARRMVFHEDPQAAIVIARDNGIELDRNDEKVFLNEMRYLRVRDWLFDIFWPRPAQPNQGIREENIGGQIVQVFTKSSEDSSEIDFSKLGDTKLRV